MALSKTVNTDVGVAAVYWAVTHIVADIKRGTVQFTYAGYASKAAHDAGSAALMSFDATYPVAPSDAGILAQVIGIGEANVVATSNAPLQGAVNV